MQSTGLASGAFAAVVVVGRRGAHLPPKAWKEFVVVLVVR